MNVHHTQCINAKPMSVCRLVNPLTITHSLSWKTACHEDVHIPFLENTISHDEGGNVSVITSITIYCHGIVCRACSNFWTIFLDKPKLPTHLANYLLFHEVPLPVSSCYQH
ncbi:hypothetical protein Dimus_030358 [Dionaea muscipula]